MIEDIIKSMGITIITEDQHDPSYGIMPGDRCKSTYDGHICICSHIWNGIFYGYTEKNNTFILCSVKYYKKEIKHET